MIKLTKGDTPEILEQSAEAWTKVIVDKLAADEVLTDTEKTRYRHPQIKAALIAETHGKCAYCESKLLHIHHGDVEHIFPKSLDPAKTVEWENLTLACEVCNQKKSNLDPNLQYIIDPYILEPRDHIAFAGPLLISKGTNHGTNTRALLDLNRGNLVERRSERLEKLISIAETMFRLDLPLPARQALYDNFIANDIGPENPYSAMAMVFLEQVKRNLPADMTA